MMLRNFIVFTLFAALCISIAVSEPQQKSSSDSQARFLDLGTLLGGNRYPYNPYRPYYPGGVGGGGYPGGYPMGGGGYGGGYPGSTGYGGYGGYGTNFIGNGGYGGGGYGGYGGNNGLSAYNGYRNSKYRGGGNLGFGYFDAFENRNTQPISVPSGYRGYN